MGGGAAAQAEEAQLLDNLTKAQEKAVTHDRGPLLIIAGAGTGKTTVLTRRIAWLIRTKRARPEEILALTFSDKAASEMNDRIDVLVPYGYTDLSLKTFHAFGDQLLRENAYRVGLTPYFNVLSQGELRVLLKRHIFDLPLNALRPLSDPTKYIDALLLLLSRAKDETVAVDDLKRYVSRMDRSDAIAEALAAQWREIADFYASYQALLQKQDAVDFGDQVLRAIRLLEENPEVARRTMQRYRYVLVDEFQDTNYAQYRLLRLLVPNQGNITVVGDDDQSIYKWRGAAVSNMLKFLEDYAPVHTVVLTDNFRSTQRILDCAYTLIRANNPDRLEVKQSIDKQLKARASEGEEVHFALFDSLASESDWVVRKIRELIETGKRRPSEIAVLVRSNREADGYLRSMNLAGIPWRFSGASGLFARPDVKTLVSCVKALAEPDDTMSWFHVASSFLYAVPMQDLVAIAAEARRRHRSFRDIVNAGLADAEWAVSDAARKEFSQLAEDVQRLLEFSRNHTCGQVLYQWLADRGVLEALSREDSAATMERLHVISRFFEQLQRVDSLVGGSLLEVVANLELFQAMANESIEEEDVWADRVSVLTLHKAKGLEFPIVFMVGLVQGRFPSTRRRDVFELPDALVKDILPEGNHHLQEERRLFYVGMTRAKEILYLTSAVDCGGKTKRKVSQFVLEALNLPSPSAHYHKSEPFDLIQRAAAAKPLAMRPPVNQDGLIKLDPHGADDYLTCPMKYRYSHVLRIPIMRHHLVVYGSAVHRAIELFFKHRLAGDELSLAGLLECFEAGWSSEGFLTREHEEQRLQQGREVLQRFYERQQTAVEKPTWIEKPFSVRLHEKLQLSGRWDRVDVRGENAVIIDYKTAEVGDAKHAEMRAKESFQLLLYAFAWRCIEGKIPDVELHFVQNGLVGRASFTDKQLNKAAEQLETVEKGVRERNFKATPSEFACRWCAYQGICPFAAHAKPA